MNNILINLITPIVTIIGNVMVYYFLREKIDTKIEEFKISFSNNYKERFEIIKNINFRLNKIRTIISEMTPETFPDEFLLLMEESKACVKYCKESLLFIPMETFEQVVNYIEKHVIQISEINSFLKLKSISLTYDEKLQMVNKLKQAINSDTLFDLEFQILTAMKKDLNIKDE